MERTFVRNLVSVIIPVYNSEKFIKSTLESVIKQTYSEIEIVIVDDCSTDSSRQIVEKITNTQSIAESQKSRKIFYYRQPINQGAAVARNKALELASGQYIAFLDSDDMWKPEKLEKQISFMKSRNIGFCFSAIEMINQTGEVVKSKRDVKEEVTYSFLLKNTMIPTSSVVIDRNIVGDFQMPLMRGGQDYATWLMLLRKVGTAYGINEALVQYRIGHSSLSSNKLNSLKQVWNIQTRQEKINKIEAVFNLFCFCFNALKKYFL